MNSLCVSQVDILVYLREKMAEAWLPFPQTTGELLGYLCVGVGNCFISLLVLLVLELHEGWHLQLSLVPTASLVIDIR